MEAKDTVLSNGKLLEIFGTPNFTERQGREKQAEISFKAGRQEIIKFVEKKGFRTLFGKRVIILSVEDWQKWKEE